MGVQSSADKDGLCFEANTAEAPAKGALPRMHLLFLVRFQYPVYKLALQGTVYKLALLTPLSGVYPKMASPLLLPTD